jgi:predicted AAA+ superfamily ATPase
MSGTGHPTDREDKRELRKEHPSGWLYLTQHDAIPILVDALLDLPTNREFNKTELAEHAGVTRQTVGNYTDLMQEVELIEEVPNTSPSRYRVADSDVVRELFELNSALNTVSSEAN